MSRAPDGIYAVRFVWETNQQTVVADAVRLVPAPAADGYYVHADHLGSPQALTDDAQQEVWRIDTRPFGEVEALTWTVENNQRFPGQYADAESGYSYNYFRDYEPALGRYLQSDPIGLAGGINTFAYVGGNPVGTVDPMGLEPAQSYAQCVATYTATCAAIGTAGGAIYGGVTVGVGGGVACTFVAPGVGTVACGAAGVTVGATTGAGIGFELGGLTGLAIGTLMCVGEQDCEQVREECHAQCVGETVGIGLPDPLGSYRKCVRACMAAQGCLDY